MRAASRCLVEGFSLAWLLLAACLGLEEAAHGARAGLGDSGRFFTTTADLAAAGFGTVDSIAAGRAAVFVAGEARGRGELLVARFSPDGRLVWRRAFGGLCCRTSLALGATGLVVAAHTYRPGLLGQQAHGGSDIAVVRLGTGGGVLWARLFGGPGDETEGGVAVDAAGGVLVAGVRADPNRPPPAGTPVRTFLLRYSGGGDLRSVLSFRTPGRVDYPRTLAISAGGVVIAGPDRIDEEVADPAARPADAFLARFGGGGLRWIRRFGGGTLGRPGAKVTIATHLVQGEDGRLYLAGVTGTPRDKFPMFSQVDLFVAAVASNGRLTWSHVLGGPNLDGSGGLATLAGPRTLFVAGTWGASGGEDVYRPRAFLQGFSLDGRPLRLRFLATPGGALALAASPSGCLYLAAWARVPGALDRLELLSDCAGGAGVSRAAPGAG